MVHHHQRTAWRAALVWVAAGVALALLPACQQGPSEAASQQPDAGAILLGPEDVAVVRRERLQAGPRIAGSLEPERQATVRSELSGSVVEVRAELGQPVKQGELLARLEARVERDAYGSAQSAVRSAAQELAVAQRQVERTHRLVEAGALAERDLELARSTAASAQARLDEARARLASAAEQLEAASVRSPMEGIVSVRSVNAGDVVSPGTPLFTVIAPSSVRLQASVPSEQIAMLDIGTPVIFEVRGYPGQTFTGRIERIAPAADPATRQLPILVSIPNKEGKLVAGLFAEGRVATEWREALVAPQSALETSGAGAFVYRVNDGRVEAVPVQLGLSDPAAEQVELIGDISEGDRLLTGAARSTPPGTQVQLGSPPATDE